MNLVTGSPTAASCRCTKNPTQASGIVHARRTPDALPQTPAHANRADTTRQLRTMTTHQTNRSTVPITLNNAATISITIEQLGGTCCLCQRYSNSLSIELCRNTPIPAAPSGPANFTATAARAIQIRQASTATKPAYRVSCAATHHQALLQMALATVISKQPLRVGLSACSCSQAAGPCFSRPALCAWPNTAQRSRLQCRVLRLQGELRNSRRDKCMLARMLERGGGVELMPSHWSLASMANKLF